MFKFNLSLYLSIILLCFYTVFCVSKKLECHFWGQKTYISCTGPGGEVECETVKYSDAALIYTGGHTPIGFYAIAPFRINSRVYNSPWYNLYPRKKDNSGWWDYAAFNPDTYLSSLGLHRGLAVRRGYASIAVPDNNCWDKLSKVINSSIILETIETTMRDVFGTNLTLVEAKVIGRLTVHD